jgi:hypothetical protein
MATVTVAAVVTQPSLQDQLFDQMPAREWLPIAELLASLNERDGHQRPLNKAHAAKIAAEFDMKSVGHLLVNRRANGRLWLIDGQHRAEAMRIKGFDLAPCDLYEGLTPAEEAEAWVKRNSGSLSAVAFDAFRGKMQYDAVAQEIERVVRASGFFIPEQVRGAWGNPRAISSVATLREIYEEGGAAVLADVLTTIRKAWPEDRRARQAEMLMGMHIFLAVYRKRLNRERVDRRLMETPHDELLRKANALRGLYSTKLNSLIALALVEVYNYKVRGDLRLDATLVSRYRMGGSAARAMVTAKPKPARTK